MSLLSKIGKLTSFIPGVGGLIGKGITALGALKGVATKLRPPTQLPLPGIGGPVAGGLGGLPMALGRGAGTLTGRVLRGGGGIAAGVATGMLFDQFGNPVKKKRRRMNPCNERALRRALRRIESYDRVNKRVQKSLRKACPTPRRAPSRRKC